MKGGQNRLKVPVKPPEDPARSRPSMLFSFARHIVQAGDCWLWTGATNAQGYGRLWVYNRVQLAHRYAYRIWVGPIEGRDIDHTCGRRTCVWPAHLEAIDHQTNIDRIVTLQQPRRLAL